MLSSATRLEQYYEARARIFADELCGDNGFGAAAAGGSQLHDAQESASDTQWLWRDPDAIARAAEWKVGGIDELTHYVGLGRSRAIMLTKGNGRVAPLTQRIPEIARLTGASA
jgi:hypothetical protein